MTGQVWVLCDSGSQRWSLKTHHSRTVWKFDGRHESMAAQRPPRPHRMRRKEFETTSTAAVEAGGSTN